MIHVSLQAHTVLCVHVLLTANVLQFVRVTFKVSATCFAMKETSINSSGAMYAMSVYYSQSF